MNEVKGDILQLITKGDWDAFCITTNGIVKRDGKAVMGAGIAKTCRNTYSGLDTRLGNLIKQRGNVVQTIGRDTRNDVFIISFPTKDDWRDPSTIDLIKRSCEQLIVALDSAPHIKKVLLPRPGCANGGLKWEDVRPAIEGILDERIYVATY